MKFFRFGNAMKILHFFKTHSEQVSNNIRVSTNSIPNGFFLISKISLKFSTNHLPTLIGKVVIYLDKDEWLGLYPSQHLVNYESAIYKEKTSI